MPRARHQTHFGIGRGRRGLDQGNDLVHVGQGNSQAFEDMATITRLAQFKDITTRNDFAAVRQEAFQHLLQVEQARLAIDQRHHVHTEGVLQLRHLVQIVQDDVGDLATLQLDHDTHTGFIRLVADFRNAFDLLLIHQLGNLLEQGTFVDLVGQLINDDRLAIAALV